MNRRRCEAVLLFLLGVSVRYVKGGKILEKLAVIMQDGPNMEKHKLESQIIGKSV